MSHRKTAHAIRLQASLFMVAAAVALGATMAACGDGSDTTQAGSGGSGGGTGSGGSGAASACDPGPTEKPSAQKVTVDITNGTGADRFVLTGCQDCEVLRVEKMGDLDYVTQPLLITAGQSCGCECPAPGPVYALGYHRIKAGETYAASWDARTLALCEQGEDCGMGMTATVTLGALQPAGAGDYRISFGVVETLLDECTLDDATGEVTCTPPAMPGIDPGGAFYPVEVTLPASGDASAALTLE